MSQLDYPYIKAWGRLLHSAPYYIEDQIRRARETHAPRTAIYWHEDEGWHIYENIKSIETKLIIDNFIKDMGIGVTQK